MGMPAISKRPMLLARLSWKFSHQPETVATEALAHILSGSAAARDVLGGFLRSHGADVGPVARVRAEVTGEEGDRPDLACKDRDGTERVLIELKFWAGLTGNQPVTYLKRLPEDPRSTLLVVAPSRRIETLWPELKRRARKGMDVELGDDHAEPEVRRATVGTGRVLMLASWRVLLEALESAALAAGDEAAVNDIGQLSGLAELQDTTTLLPLHPEQLDPESARLILNLDRLVDDVCARAFATAWASRGGMQKRWEGGPFQYMMLGGCSVWFGLRFELWSKYEQTPLWLGFQDSAVQGRMPRKLEQRWGENPPKSLSAKDVVPIRLRTGCEYEEVLDDVVGQLEHFAGLFQQIYAADADTPG